VELQRNMDEAKTPIALQNKVLSWVFGGRANVVDATDYTSMGPCPATCPCKFVYKIKHIYTNIYINLIIISPLSFDNAMIGSVLQ
jgi:hypothetical protein